MLADACVAGNFALVLLRCCGAYTIEATSFEALSAGDYTLRLGRDDMQLRGRALASTAL